MNWLRRTYTLMVWDLRLLARSRQSLAVVAALVLSGVTAFVSGLELSRAQRANHRKVELAAVEARRSLLDKIADGDRWAPIPVSARANIHLPPAPMPHVAAGRSDLDPQWARASIFSSSYTLFRDYQVASPLALALGRFDFAFVVQVLVPLLVIAMGYGVLAQEREGQRYGVLATHGVTAPQLLSAKLMARGLVLLVPLGILFVGLLLVGRSEDLALRGPWLGALVGGYFLFWFALVALVNAWGTSPGRALLTLLALWALLALVMPAVASIASRHAHPPPSRLALIAEARRAEIQATQQAEQLLEAYSHDHPELDLTESSKAPSWARNAFFISRAVDQAVAPIAEAFEQALRAQQDMVARWQYIAPGLLIQRGMMSLSGTGERRSAAFQKQARTHFADFREAVGRLTLLGQSLDNEHLAQLPVFTFSEPRFEPWAASVAGPVLSLWLAALALLGAAAARLAWSHRESETGGRHLG